MTQNAKTLFPECATMDLDPPVIADLHYTLAEIKFKEGAYEQAAMAYKLALDNGHAEKTNICGNLGISLFKLNRYEIGIKFLNQAIELKHPNAGIFTKLVDEARITQDKAVIGGADTIAQIHLDTARGYKESGATKEALENYQGALNCGHAEAAAIYLEMALTYEEISQLSQAHKYYNLALENGHQEETSILEHLKNLETAISAKLSVTLYDEFVGVSATGNVDTSTPMDES